MFDLIPNTEKRAENTTRCGVFLKNFELFGNLVKVFDIISPSK